MWAERSDGGPQELVSATGADSHEAERLMVVPRDRALHGWGMLVRGGQAILSVLYMKPHCI